MTVVLGDDESLGSDSALGTAVELANAFGEPLVLVYGVAPPGGVGEEYKVHEAAVTELAREVTSEALARARAAGAEASVELVRAKPAQALLDAAERHDARMIVVGSHGDGALRAAILGSTSHRVLNSSTRPVLVVKS